MLTGYNNPPLSDLPKHAVKRRNNPPTPFAKSVQISLLASVAIALTTFAALEMHYDPFQGKRVWRLFAHGGLSQYIPFARGMHIFSVTQRIDWTLLLIFAMQSVSGTIISQHENTGDVEKTVRHCDNDMLSVVIADTIVGVCGILVALCLFRISSPTTTLLTAETRRPAYTGFFCNIITMAGFYRTCVAAMVIPTGDLSRPIEVILRPLIYVVVIYCVKKTTVLKVVLEYDDPIITPYTRVYFLSLSVFIFYRTCVERVENIFNGKQTSYESNKSFILTAGLCSIVFFSLCVTASFAARRVLPRKRTLADSSVPNTPSEHKQTGPQSLFAPPKTLLAF